jgi:CBS-domain-containing membrane protein
MSKVFSRIVQSWGTNGTFNLAGCLWMAGMFGVLAALEANRIGLYLIPPFGATLSILFLVPDAAIAQPYALIVGSVAGASIGTLMSLFARGLGVAVLAAVVAFGVMTLLRAYHPPGVALALYPVLLHPGDWFPLTRCSPVHRDRSRICCAVSRLVDK